MTRIFLSDAELQSGDIIISDEKARYLINVMRSAAGDLLTIGDSRGNAYSAIVVSISKREVLVRIQDKLNVDPESPLRITLLQGLLKGEKMDLVIQKATELGVTEIFPVITERSQIRETRKLLRWEKIAKEASRQSGRSRIPVIHEPRAFPELFTGAAAEPGPGMIFWESGGAALCEAAERFRGKESVAIFTGPEGGFSRQEVTTASDNGFIPTTLGTRILRAETAAISAVAVIQFAIGDLGI
ncbi:MAG: 16S rRNA (uracil(1498)-N(3))-methyltransferase [Nitrospirae bacterium]|nr:16S rRNA (uracil(1498)-N(3))-methyltransferase [Nitrospirota bacterium]